MKSHKDLTVYKDSVRFSAEIYLSTSKFPKSEIFGLTSQMRRSAVSITSNIAEGSARNHTKENIQFLFIALGSASELDAQLEISKEIRFIDTETYDSLSVSLDSISKMIQGLIRYYKSKTT